MNKLYLLLILLFPFSFSPVLGENNWMTLETPENEVWEWHEYPLVFKSIQDNYEIIEGNLLVQVEEQVLFNDSTFGMEFILIDLLGFQSPIDLDFTFSYLDGNNTFTEYLSKSIEFDIERDHEEVQELSWLYSDYNYWGPNPAYKLIINAQDTYFGRVEDRDHRFDDITEDVLIKYVTDPNDWAMIQNLTHSANRWQYFEYNNLLGTSDGPASLHKATLTFANSQNELLDNYDDTDGSGGRSYVSGPYYELKGFIEEMVTQLETEVTLLDIPSPSLTLFIIPFFILVINRKIKVSRVYRILS